MTGTLPTKCLFVNKNMRVFTYSIGHLPNCTPILALLTPITEPETRGLIAGSETRGAFPNNSSHHGSLFSSQPAKNRHPETPQEMKQYRPWRQDR
jgi:hypothetical protein